MAPPLPITTSFSATLPIHFKKPRLFSPSFHHIKKQKHKHPHLQTESWIMLCRLYNHPSPESRSHQGFSWDTAASQGSCKPLAMATPRSAAANAGPSLRPSPNIQTVPWGRGESRSNLFPPALQRQKISKNLWLWCRLLGGSMFMVHVSNSCGAWDVLPMFTSWTLYEDKYYIYIIYTYLFFFDFLVFHYFYFYYYQLQVPCLFGLRGGDLPSLPTKCAFGATFSRGVLRPFSRSFSPPRIQFSLSPGVIFDRLLQGSGREFKHFIRSHWLQWLSRFWTSNAMFKSSRNCQKWMKLWETMLITNYYI